MASGGQTYRNDVYRSASGTIGRACGPLLVTEPTWVHRRVETIDVLSTELARRTVSVDFTVPEPLQNYLKLGSQWAVPIATLEKKRLRNFDLRDHRGHSVAVVGRDHNGEISTQALLGAADRALRATGGGVVAPGTEADLRAIAKDPPAEARKALAGMVRASQNGDAQLQTLLADDYLSFLLARLTESYALLAVLDDINRRTILKFSYDEALYDDRGWFKRTAEGIGLQALMLDVEVPAAARCMSYHAEVVVPEELRIDFAVLYDQDDGTIYGHDGDSDRAAIYADPKVDPLGRPRLALWLRAQRPGFPMAAASISVITTALLWLGAVVWEPQPTVAGPAISVLLAASALFAGAVVHRGEHRLVKGFFFPPRFLLALVALCALGAGASLALGAPADDRDLVWTISAGATSLFAGMLVISCWRARPLIRRRRQDSSSAAD